MMTTLSDEQRTALEQQAGAPLYVNDPLTQLQYVLIPAEVYQRVRGLIEADDFDVAETYVAQERALAEAGWDDPALDAYNDYDSHRPPQ